MNKKTTKTLTQNQASRYQNRTSNELREVIGIIRKIVLRPLGQYLRRIDSNWYFAEITFTEPTKRRVRGPDNRVLSKTFQPVCAHFNGPRYGSVEIPVDAIQALLSEPLMVMLRTCADYHDFHCGNAIRFWNPRYRLELINGRTLIHFENCDLGRVENFNHKTRDFEIYILNDLCSQRVVRVESYTIGQIKREFAMTKQQCQAVGLEYLSSNITSPFLEVEESAKPCPICSEWSCHRYHPMDEMRWKKQLASALVN